MVGTTVWGGYVEGKRDKDWAADRVAVIKDLHYAEVLHVFRDTRLPGAYVLYTPKGASYVREEWRPPSGYYKSHTAAEAVSEKYALRNKVIDWLGWAQLKEAPQWALRELAEIEMSHLKALGYRCVYVGPASPQASPYPAHLQLLVPSPQLHLAA